MDERRGNNEASIYQTATSWEASVTIRRGKTETATLARRST